MQDAIGEAITRVRENCAPRFIVWVGGVPDHYDTLIGAIRARDKWFELDYEDVQVEDTRG